MASEWAGFTTVGQCEFANYPTKVLEKHWPNVPRWSDIRDVTLESVRDRGIRTVDLISGGFPCQPFSVAGKQKGENDDRYLWPEMLRVISELKPNWVIGENVAGIVNMALEQVCLDLEAQDYEVQPFIIPACAVDAPHQRKRVFIVAHTRRTLRQGSIIGRENEDEVREWNANITERSSKAPRLNVANPDSPRLKELNTSPKSDIKGLNTRGIDQDRAQWELEPNVGRVANGVSKRVDRLKCLGNSVVPQQVYPILQAIADIENKGAA